MVINDYRNKPFGPGGGTRRLHQISLRNGFAAELSTMLRMPLIWIFCKSSGMLWGRNRIDEGVKDMFSPGMVPPYRTIF